MKLELLLVLLAVAVLAPGLTQGRIVSTCELKEKLGAALTLDQDLQKHKEHILAIVICEVTKWSHLNTSLINVEGERVAPTTARPTTAAKVTKHSTARPDETAAEAKKTAPKAAKPKTTKPKATKPTTAATTTLISTTDVPTSAEAETTETSQATSPASRRRKREVDSASKEDVDVSTERPRTLDELLNDSDLIFDEEELMMDDNMMTTEEEDKEEEEESKGQGDGETSEPEEQTEADDEDEDEDEDAENEEETDDQTPDDNEVEDAETTEEDDDVEEEEEEVQMSEEVVKRMPWSLGHYGLFQLTDSHFCDSGFRWSRNKCNATCTDFADDDIADDIDCLVMSGYWR
ncbi:hypothetical protein INR49_018319 [Caranx melampygus]|nr:hypothetical protein INR49_018319 [Caranx melampygus]